MPNGFDIAIVLLILLSALLGWLRGIVRSLIGLLAWVVGVIAGFMFAPVVASWLPPAPDYPLLPQAIAFVAIFVLALVVGALVAWPLRALLRVAGLAFVDRGLGLVFGSVRGVLVVLAFVVAAGLTALPTRDWWQNSILAPHFAEGALALRPWLPPAWSQRIRYAAPEPAPRGG